MATNADDDAVAAVLAYLAAWRAGLEEYFDSVLKGFELGQRLGPREGLKTALAVGDLHADNRAQGGATNLVGLIIGIVIAAIVGVAVGIPVINDAINSANLTGTTALIVGFIPVMIGLMIFVATASPIMRRM